MCTPEQWDLAFWSDSAWPTGGFALSHGLETLVEEGRVTGRADWAMVVRLFLQETAAGEGVALWHVLEAPPERRPAAAAAAGRRLVAWPRSAEADAASRAQARRLLALARDDGAVPPPGPGPWYAGPAWGLVAGWRGWLPEAALTAFLAVQVKEMTAAAARLLRVDPGALYRDAAGLGPVVAAAARRARRPLSSLSGGGPWLEIATLRHARQQMRLFRT
ncbi:Urease accessory protein UreF [Candidatus Hydrogenisulfobacillus filiaventi]|uniref:Urease accessory protein UreF n=1 Tax=Candidatus Hydrogenisulfobacillus filiaventi TaxID=2707344 RepID=A0A6F8ZJC1_9FIRM|nr:hypothetical protein [Bacillota bacterium]CAB1129754.1 Urease accessory protein UreF [Candidatus Hydrogenisulfobacillus filiaventi]